MDYVGESSLVQEGERTETVVVTKGPTEVVSLQAATIMKGHLLRSSPWRRRSVFCRMTPEPIAGRGDLYSVGPQAKLDRWLANSGASMVVGERS